MKFDNTTSLPSKPQDMLLDPNLAPMFEAEFADAMPIPCQKSVLERIQVFDSNYTCRGKENSSSSLSIGRSTDENPQGMQQAFNMLHQIGQLFGGQQIMQLVHGQGDSLDASGGRGTNLGGSQR